MVDLVHALHGADHAALRYRLLVFLGDTARYQHDPSAARRWYGAALHTDPHDGRALNQLAVLAMPREPLPAAYFLLRALCAARPFARAAMNLDALYAANNAGLDPLWAMVRSDPSKPGCVCYRCAYALCRHGNQQHALITCSWAGAAKEAVTVSIEAGRGAEVAMAIVCVVAGGWRGGDWQAARVLAAALVDMGAGNMHVVYGRVVLSEALADGPRLGTKDAADMTDEVRAAALVQARAWRGGGGARLPSTCIDQALVGFSPLTRAHQTLAWGTPVSDPGEIEVLLWARLAARAPDVLVRGMFIAVRPEA